MNIDTQKVCVCRTEDFVTSLCIYITYIVSYQMYAKEDFEASVGCKGLECSELSVLIDLHNSLNI